MKIAFLWDSHASEIDRDDGLGSALKILEQRHTIRYLHPRDWRAIQAFRPDVLLHWSALNSDLDEYPYKKALCFAGGTVTEENVGNYDLYFVESKVNEDDFQRFGKNWMRAFGTNEKVFSPQKMVKEYDAFFGGAFAKWKRSELFAEALGPRGLAVGQKQKAEPECYDILVKHGVSVKDTRPRNYLNLYMNQSHTVVNPADYWGGGQRLTLEAMSCNIPPIVMSDSPKNCEYVIESGFGLIVNPDPYSIREAILEIKRDPMTGGREYILSKWTSMHYANALEKGLVSL